jgi:amino acid transporter
MLFCSLAIALVIPADKINLVAGVMQFFSLCFASFGISWALPIVTILIVVGSIGSIINWLISPAKGLLHASEFGFLPPFFSKVNRHGVASRILIVQAILVSLFCSLVFLVPSVNAFYWFLTTLSTELYMIMYILMFLSALRLHYRLKDRPQIFKIPGKAYGIWSICLLGLFGSLLTILVGFFPPAHIEIASPLRYMSMIGFGNLLMISPVFLFYLYKKRF